MPPSLRGRTALVTGASSGLGAELASNLGRRGCNLVIVARRADRLRALADKLAVRYGISVLPIAADLGDAATPQRLYDETRTRGITIDILVNNAGLGLHGNFTDIPWEREQQLLTVDIFAVVHLTKLFLNDMVARDRGHVMLVSSTMAYQAVPTYASYSAAKAFVLLFGEAISYELRRTNVRVSVVSPGMMPTEWQQVAGQRPILFQRLTSMPPKRVARLCVDAMLAGKPSTVPGWVNAMMPFSARLVPRRLASALAAAIPRVGLRE